MKIHKSILVVVIISMVCAPLFLENSLSSAVDNTPDGINLSVSSEDTGGQVVVEAELAGSYIIDFLSPENAPDKTLTIKNPEGANISATWVDPKHGYQVLTNVSFDGEVLTFNALSGTPGNEYFYFHLNLYESYLVGYARTREMHKSPVVGIPVD